jgi:hypothetical protein
MYFYQTITAKYCRYDNTKTKPHKMALQNKFILHNAKQYCKQENIVQSLTLGLNTKFASKQPKQNVQINLKRVQHLSKSLTRTNNHNISWFPKNNTIRTFTFTTIITSVLCKTSA